MIALLALTLLTHPLPQSAHRVLADGEVISGSIQCESIFIPQSATVWIEADTSITVHGFARIEGRLCILNADAIGLIHAPNLEITSPVLIDIPGLIIGGHGMNGASFYVPGGDGSRIRLAAPVVYIDGSVTAGNGGDGAATRAGGNGGDVHVEGFMLVRKWDPHASIRSGMGGMGSYPSDSGTSGDAIARVPESVLTRMEEWMPQASQALRAFPSIAEDPALCPNGTVGGDGANAVSANGADGADGANGSSASPAGKDGRPGRSSGDAVATDGLPGGNGANCCPNPGGNGGKGGRGGSATSGSGGKGGKGGDAWNGTAAGGSGGDGGNSGQARAGRAGNGGSGGKSNGAGGAPGDLGTATAGAAGVGGVGGNGSPQGPAGGSGTQGSVLSGAGGTAGMNGGSCP